MSVDNRLPTNQSQLDIASKLDDVKTAIENINIGGSTVVANPSGTATADLTKLQVDNEIYGIPSGGSGGHTILDDDGTALAQEDNLQFNGVYSTDNSEDGVTEVNVYREMTKAEFDLLSSDEKKGFIRVTDEPDIYSDGHFQPVIYSTEEREIGVWTDGKPLYQKTWQLSTPLTINANSWGTIETLSEQINVINGVGGYDLGTEYVSYSVGGNCDTSNVLTIYNFRNSQQSYNIITLQYTKSTDVAGSGTWTPQGVPAVHYSTDEQVIGTYFGDTLYQKTIVLTSDAVIADSWTTIYTDALIGNIAQLVDGKYNNVDNKGVYGVLNFKPNGNNLQAVYPISGGLSVLAGARFTLQYTKSS